MAGLRPIVDVAAELGLAPEHVLPWGRHRAKIDLQALESRPETGRLVLVSAINPTPPGEGKTTTSIALAMGLRLRGRRPVAALRQPSMGPVFGVKGGGTGGGRATFEPAQDINLHFTGDIHAVAAAHNLLAALADNAAYYQDPVPLNPQGITWPRTLDMNDRFLRNVIVGLGGKSHGVPRETRFDITAASEVMAILGLASSLEDLAERCGRIVIGKAHDGSLVRASDLHAGPSMAAVLKDALMPNLAQTAEGGPVIVHGGPFANIAHGCSSLLGTQLGMRYATEVITEGGFGFDLGGEKFLDIKCRLGGFWPRALVLVATLRALKSHGGVALADTTLPNAEALVRGFDHLKRHLETAAGFGLPVVVAVNGFPTDTADEIALLREFCAANGARCAFHTAFAHGGEGALELADTVLEVLDGTDAQPPTPQYSYPLDAPLAAKIRAVAQRVYGANDVVLTPTAQKQARDIEKQGGGSLPVCMAKTHLSLSDDPTRQGRPTGFDVTVRELRLSAGAGFVVALTGDIMTMPGLPKVPASRRVRLESDGRILGLMQGE
jgi:formate--tetrahydrofolate ligase